MPEPDVSVVAELLNERVVVSGEKSSTSDAVRQLVDDSAGDRIAVVCRRSTACRRLNKARARVKCWNNIRKQYS